MKGIPADQFEAPPDVSWVLASDRGITFSDRLPSGSRLVEGEWWAADYDGKPLVSMEADIADGLGLAIGDDITVNVIGRPVTAEIANLRKVDWQSLAINFVMVFSPSAFRGAPHTYLATLTWPDTPTLEGEVALLRSVTSDFPGIISIRVKEALDRVNGLIAEIGWGVRAAASITLIIAVLVLGGALAAGQRQRVYDAVVLKTLGATRRKLVLAFAVEYLILGLATAVFALAAGGLAAWFVISRTMESMFTFLPGVALTAVALAIVVTVGFGLAGSWRMLGQKAAPVLRNL
jgi:putative ABC transport system permease protein